VYDLESPEIDRLAAEVLSANLPPAFHNNPIPPGLENTPYTEQLDPFKGFKAFLLNEAEVYSGANFGLQPDADLELPSLTPTTSIEVEPECSNPYELLLNMSEHNEPENLQEEEKMPCKS
jgi:hypothetical protein